MTDIDNGNTFCFQILHNAEKCLDLIDATVEAPQMDYGYCRVVRLYKGIVKPEEFIDIPAMQKAVLPQENRVNLELNGMYYGLYCYWTLHGEPEKAAQAIRALANPALAAIPIVALSANVFQSDINKSLDSGMEAHLTKPIDIPALMKTIERILKRRAGAGGS